MSPGGLTLRCHTSCVNRSECYRQFVCHHRALLSACPRLCSWGHARVLIYQVRRRLPIAHWCCNQCSVVLMPCLDLTNFAFIGRQRKRPSVFGFSCGDMRAGVLVNADSAPLSAGSLHEYAGLSMIAVCGRTASALLIRRAFFKSEAIAHVMRLKIATISAPCLVLKSSVCCSRVCLFSPTSCSDSSLMRRPTVLHPQLVILQNAQRSIGRTLSPSLAHSSARSGWILRTPFRGSG